MEVIENGQALANILREARTLGVVGLSPRPERDSHSVSQSLQESGYRIVGIHPDHATLLGAKAYPSLSALPEDVRNEIDIVVVFRRPDAVPALIEEATSLGLDLIWLQPGASTSETLAKVSHLPGRLVQDKCIRVVVAQLDYYAEER